MIKLLFQTTKRKNANHFFNFDLLKTNWQKNLIEIAEL